ncbi:hypothetical protein ACMGDM_19060 [Sphingomonas sp. DT-51]|uniref:hypothetical protein n=1 Tax=Sphingomonas sp. DT-51 TaxID=3396165 RepID=UPI003F1B356E
MSAIDRVPRNTASSATTSTTNPALPRERLGDALVRGFRASLARRGDPEVEHATERPQPQQRDPHDRTRHESNKASVPSARLRSPQPDASLAFATPPEARTSAVARPDPAVTGMGVDPAAAAAIERLAGAIAAALTRGEQPVYAIEFNGASPLAERALLTREPGGALTLRLDGVPTVPIVAPAAIECELRVALDRRRIRLERLEYGAAKKTNARLIESASSSKRFAESRPGTIDA